MSAEFRVLPDSRLAATLMAVGQLVRRRAQVELSEGFFHRRSTQMNADSFRVLGEEFVKYVPLENAEEIAEPGATPKGGPPRGLLIREPRRCRHR